MFGVVFTRRCSSGLKMGSVTDLTLPPEQEGRKEKETGLHCIQNSNLPPFFKHTMTDWAGSGDINNPYMDHSDAPHIVTK